MAKQAVIWCGADRQHHHIHNLPDGRRVCGGCLAEIKDH